MAETLSLSHIQTARKRIAPCIRRTPLSTSVTLSERRYVGIVYVVHVIKRSWTESKERPKPRFTELPYMGADRETVFFRSRENLYGFS